MASGAAKWRGLYFGDHLTNMQRARGAARALFSSIENPSSPESPLPPVGPSLWYDLVLTILPSDTKYRIIFVPANVIFIQVRMGYREREKPCR